MFHLELPYMRIPLNLSNAPDFPKKMEMVINHLKIEEIFCQVTNTEDLVPPPCLEEKMLDVEAICIPPADPYTSRASIVEVLGILEAELKKYVRENEIDDYGTISTQLENIIHRCKEYRKNSDLTNILMFNHNLKFKVKINSAWYTKLHQYLNFDTDVRHDFNEQLNIRKLFFEEMIELLETELVWHKRLPDVAAKPYTWTGEHAALEASEILYVLHTFVQRIEINEKAGGTFTKLKKQFFELFGLDVNDYHKKTGQIRNRKKDDHFLNLMLDKLNGVEPGFEKPSK